MNQATLMDLRIISNMPTGTVLPEEKIDSIREFVRGELCEKNQLEKDAFR